MSQNLILNSRTANNTINSAISVRRGLRFRRRWESLGRNGQSVESNSQRNSNNNNSINENVL